MNRTTYLENELRKTKSRVKDLEHDLVEAVYSIGVLNSMIRDLYIRNNINVSVTNDLIEKHNGFVNGISEKLADDDKSFEDICAWISEIEEEVEVLGNAVGVNTEDGEEEGEMPIYAGSIKGSVKIMTLDELLKQYAEGKENKEDTAKEEESEVKDRAEKEVPKKTVSKKTTPKKVSTETKSTKTAKSSSKKEGKKK